VADETDGGEMAVRIAVLGPAEIELDGRRRPIAAARVRALLTALALDVGRPLTADALVNTVWGEQPPSKARVTLQGYVAELRRVLEPGRAAGAPPQVLVTAAGGYALQVPEEAVDALRFEHAVRRATALLDHLVLPPGGGVAGVTAAALTEATAVVEEALRDWRGAPFADLPDEPRVVAERDRLRSLHVEARATYAAARIGLGQAAEVAADLEPLAREHPWHEPVWELWALALARAGRQADALARLRELGDALRDELGIDPTARVRDLETAILRQESAPEPHGSRPAQELALVGREHEMGVLDRILDRAASGGTHVAHLTGEHGVGKTRLCDEVAARARGRGFAVRQVECAEHARSEPLRVWERLGLADRPGDDRLLLIVEDLQWVDEPSAAKLLDFAAETGRGGVVLLFSQRLTERQLTPTLSALHAMLGRRAEWLEVADLGPDASRHLLKTASGVEVHPQVADQVRARVGGNPFLLMELARNGDFTPTVLPRSIRAVISHHLGGLPDRTLDLLRGAALIDDLFDSDLIASAAGLEVDDVFASLAPAVADGVLKEEVDDRFHFPRPVVREVLAGQLTGPERSRWHARIARGIAHLVPLNRPDRRAAYVEHWAAAGFTYAAEAWRGGLHAVESALRADCYSEAATLAEAVVVAQRMDHGATAAERKEVADLVERLEDELQRRDDPPAPGRERTGGGRDAALPAGRSAAREDAEARCGIRAR
jgi:DNA-binding SARP family transcriptional activator